MGTWKPIQIPEEDNTRNARFIQSGVGHGLDAVGVLRAEPGPTRRRAGGSARPDGGGDGGFRRGGAAHRGPPGRAPARAHGVSGQP